MLNKSIINLLLFAFTIYSITGCSGNESIRSLPDDEIGFRDSEQFPVRKDKLYSACLLVLQEKGYIIKLSDPKTGLINAELNSSCLIKEDADELRRQDNTCANFLSIILLVGIIFMIVSALSSGAENSNTGNECCDQENYRTETTVSSYQYNITLTISSVNIDKAVCRLLLIRSYIENGTVVSQNSLMNKDFNNNFFNDIREKLVF